MIIQSKMFWFNLTMNFIFVSCSTAKPVAYKLAPVSPNSKPSNGNSQAEINLDTYLTPELKAPVTSVELDSSAFRLNGLRVGIQEYLLSKSPTVAFFIPDLSDYIQLIRCDHNSLIRGAFDNLQDIDISHGNAAEETKIFQANDFWNAALLNPTCQLLSTHVEEKDFIDNSAPSGSYRYLARACVSLDRIKNIGVLNRAVCSRQVGVSPEVKGYINERSILENEALSSQNKWQEKLEALAMDVSKGALALNSALKACDTLEQDRAARVQRKNALFSILGSSASVASRLLDPANTGKNFTEKAKSVWQQRGEVKTEGQKLGQAISWLFSSARDFPKSCTAAERIAADNETNATELKDAHEQFALAADAVQAAIEYKKALQK